MTINPFDLKTVLLAKHAQHVVVIHFPIALFLAGVLFDFVGLRKKNSALASAAYFNFSLAALSTVPAIATGLLAWQWALEGEKVKGILRMHLVSAWLSSLLIAAVWLIHYLSRRSPDSSLPRYRYLLETAGVLLVALTGHLGGFLSGVNSGG